MIDKRELLDEASRLSLRPDVVEKDYVLGWALAGIYAHGELRETWLFKGGTCLKSPTYVYECAWCRRRFSHRQLGGTLRPHKDKSGYPCAGRSGYLVDTRY